VIAELEAVRSKRRVTRVEFFDDDFCCDVSWLEEFSQQYREKINVPFFCLAHPADITERTAHCLKKANCREVEIGIQSLDPLLRREVLHRYETNEQFEEAVRLLQANGMSVIPDNIMGLPGQGERDLLDMAGLYIRLKPRRIHLMKLCYFPRADIVGIAQKRGILNDSDVEEIERGGRADSFFACTSREEVGFRILFLLISILPRRLSRFILRKRIYRALAFPGARFFHFTLLALFFPFAKKISIEYGKRTMLRYTINVPSVLWFKLLALCTKGKGR
jgi:hypothetical protein